MHFMRLGLSSTLIREVFSSKRHRPENALESGSKQERIHIVISADGQKWSKTHQNKNIPSACVCSVCLPRVQLTSQRAILSFSNVLVWKVENASKESCGHEPIKGFSIGNKNAYFAKGIGVYRALEG